MTLSLVPAPAPSSCQVCGCTEARGCPSGCAWADDSQTMCTACASVACHAGLAVLYLVKQYGTRKALDSGGLSVYLAGAAEGFGELAQRLDRRLVASAPLLYDGSGRPVR